MQSQHCNRGVTPRRGCKSEKLRPSNKGTTMRNTTRNLNQRRRLQKIQKKLGKAAKQARKAERRKSA